MHPEEISSGRRREVRGRPSGLKGATASPQRPPYGRPLTPETATAAQTPAPHGQTPTAPTPSHAADRRQEAKTNERPKGWLQTVSRHYEQKSLAKKSYT